MNPRIDPIGIDESFRFGCHSGISCFNACCGDLNQFLTPYDILRLKNGLGLSSADFLQRFTVQHDGPETGLPVVTLRPKCNEEKACPFVSAEGCTVYDHRPSSCRIYPVMRAISKSRETGKVTEHFAIIREPHCNGFSESNTQTVREWIENQGLADYFAANDRLMGIIALKNQLRPGPLELRDRLLFHTALYDLDQFRKQATETDLLAPLNIDSAEQLAAMASDELLLLEWGHRWVEYALFGIKQPL